MNHKAGDATTEDSSPTPWDAIDPNEPAHVAVLDAPADEPQALVYHAPELERTHAVPSRAKRKATKISLNVVQPRVIPQDMSTPLADSALQPAEPANGGAEPIVVSLSATEPVKTSADSPPDSADPSPTSSLDVAPAQGAEDLDWPPAPVEIQTTVATFNAANVLDFDRDENVQVVDEPLEHADVVATTGAGATEVHAVEEAITSAAEQVAAEPSSVIAASQEAAPAANSEQPATDASAALPADALVDVTPTASPALEMFVDSPDSLDAMTAALAPIGDVTEAVGEAPAPVEEAPAHIALDAIAITEIAEPAPPEIQDIEEAEEAALPADTGSVEQLFAQAIAEYDIPSDEAEEPQPEVEPVWEDLEMDQEPVPTVTGASWTIPLLCLGIALIACCIVIPQADANRRLAYEKQVLQADLDSVQKQVVVNDEFLKKVVDDPSLAERLAQRQLKRVRKGQRVLHLNEEKAEMSPFQITNVTPPPPPPPYKPVGGIIASACYDARTRLYLMGAAMAMIACGLVMGATPNRS